MLCWNQALGELIKNRGHCLFCSNFTKLGKVLLARATPFFPVVHYVYSTNRKKPVRCMNIIIIYTFVKPLSSKNPSIFSAQLPSPTIMSSKSSLS
jgi:hypothetical protein